MTQPSDASKPRLCVVETQLKQFFDKNPDLAQRQIYVGFSGGADSSALLHALMQLKRINNITALHVNHQLQADADAWEQHCGVVAKRLGADFVSTKVVLDSTQNMEAEARQARLFWFAKFVDEDGVLLLGHHQDDLIETTLFRLLRGAALTQLKAMEPVSKIQGLYIARPFLSVTRQQLEEYCQAHGLTYVSDPSNLDTSLDRNYLRHELLPLLTQRFAQSRQALLSLQAQAQALSTIEEQKAQRFLAAQYDEFQCDYYLPIFALTALNALEQQSVLYLWLHRQGLSISQPLAMQVLNAINQGDKVKCCLDHARDYWLQAHHGGLYLYQAVKDVTLQEAFDEGSYRFEQGSSRLIIDLPLGQLSMPIVDGQIEVKFRHQMDETVRIEGQGSRRIKKFFQDFAIEPWLRHLVPFVFIDGQLVAIADYAFHPGVFQADGSLQWHTQRYRVKKPTRWLSKIFSN
ncbi:MAG: tRNA lysidine(34) synthetase TilS [Pseudomonadota bacterium]|nr:tRNA lysidine(34) synthetase TilS [Pseudomonadota bacterium]